MGKKFIQAQRANIAASRRVLAQSRNMGYKALNNTLDSIAGNLATTTGRTTASLLGSQNAQLAALRTLAARAKAKGSRITERTTDQITNRYGSAIASGTDLTAVKATAKAGAVAQRGIVGGAALLAEGNAAAAATQAAGVQQAASAAEYAASQAKLYRAKNDAALIAERQLELGKMRLQNKLDLENYRKKLKMEDDKTEAFTGASAVAGFAGDTLPSLIEIFRGSYNEESDTYKALGLSEDQVAKPGQVIALWSQNTGYGADTPQYQVALAMANSLAAQHAGTEDSEWTRDSVINAAQSALEQIYPSLTAKQSDAMQGILTTQLTGAALTNAYENGLNLNTEDPPSHNTSTGFASASGNPEKDSFWTTFFNNFGRF